MTSPSASAESSRRGGMSLFSKLPSLRSFAAIVLAVAIPMTAYFVFYVGNQQQYLMDRNQRALDSVATEIRERIGLLPAILKFNDGLKENGSFIKNNPWLRRAQVANMVASEPNSNSDLEKVAPTLKNDPWLRHLQVANIVASKPRPVGCEGREGETDYEIVGGKLIAKICKKSGDSSTSWSISVPLDDLVPALPGAAVLDGLLIVGETEQVGEAQIEYASKGAQWVGQVDLEKLIAGVIDKNEQVELLPHVRTVELYHTEVVVQHLALRVQGLNQKLALVTFVDAGRFQQAVYTISPSYWLVILALSMLLMCAAPFMKVWLVSEDDALSRRDLLMMGGALIIGTGVVVIWILDLLELRAVTHKLESTGRDIATEMSEAVGSELGDWVYQLRTELGAGWPTRNIYPCKLNDPTSCISRELNAVNRRAGPGFSAPLAEMFFVLDSDGFMVGADRTARSQPLKMSTSLKDRDYFKKIVENRSTCVELHGTSVVRLHEAWRIAPLCDPGWTPLTLDRVRTRDQGVSLAIMALPLIPLSPPSPYSADPDFLVVVAAGQLASIHQAVLPRPFSYAVIENQTGKVLYHQDDTRSLVENFYEEIQQNTLLKSAARTKHAWQGSITYHGTTRYAHLEPLQYADWSLVVLRNADMANALNFEISGAAFLQYLVFIGALAALAIPLSALLGPPKVGGRLIQNLRWPDSFGDPDRATGLYQAVTTVVVLMILLQAILIITLWEHHYGVLVGLLVLALAGYTAVTLIIGALRHHVRLNRDEVELGLEPWDTDSWRSRLSMWVAGRFWPAMEGAAGYSPNQHRWRLMVVIGVLAALISGWVVINTPMPSIGKGVTGLALWFAAMIALAPRPPRMAGHFSVQERFRRAYIGLVTSLLILLAVIPCAVIYHQTKAVTQRAFIHFAADDLVVAAHDRSQRIHADWRQRVKGHPTAHDCFDADRLQKAAAAGVYPGKLLVVDGSRPCGVADKSGPPDERRDSGTPFCEAMVGRSPVGWLFCRLPAMTEVTARIRMEMDEGPDFSSGSPAVIKADVVNYRNKLRSLAVDDYFVPAQMEPGGGWSWQFMQWLVFATLMALGVVLLKKFLLATAQNVFALDVADLEPESGFTSGQHLIDEPGDAFKERDYLLIRPDKGIVEKLKDPRPEGRKPAKVIDCAYLDPPDDEVVIKRKLADQFDWALTGFSTWAERLAGGNGKRGNPAEDDNKEGDSSDHTGGTLILNFAHMLKDTELWTRKLNVLESLLRERANKIQTGAGASKDSIVIVSELDVLSRLTQVFGRSKAILEPREAQRCIYLLHEFRKARFSQDITEETGQARKALEEFQSFLKGSSIADAEYRRLVNMAKMLWHECKSDPVTREIWTEFIMRARGAVSHGSGEQRTQISNPMINSTFESMIGLIRDRANGHYSALWAMCVPEERRQLYHMARGDVCNPRNRQVLMQLMHRGLVAHRPNLQLNSLVFRRFVLDAVQDEEVAQWRQDGQENEWSQWRLPLAAFMLAMVAIIIWTQGESVNSLGRVFAAVAALLPVLGLSGRGGGPAEGG